VWIIIYLSIRNGSNPITDSEFMVPTYYLISKDYSYNRYYCYL